MEHMSAFVGKQMSLAAWRMIRDATLYIKANSLFLCIDYLREGFS